MFVHRVEVGDLKTNCYLVGCRGFPDILLIDPGAEEVKIVKYLGDLEISPTEIVLTHSHYDHIAAAPELRTLFRIPISIHRFDAPNLEDPDLNFSTVSGNPVSFSPDRILEEGDVWNIGDNGIEVLHTHGHTEGSITLFTGDVAFCGDTVFAAGIGRTDLPGSDYSKMRKSIIRLMGLPGNTVIYPGHGPKTTVASERAFLISFIDKS